MNRKMHTALLAAAITLVGLTGFTYETFVAPQPLQAQGCGRHSGNLCQAECTRECSNGSCCGWRYWYYEQPIDPT